MAPLTETLVLCAFDAGDLKVHAVMFKRSVKIRPKILKSPVIPGEVVALDVNCATTVKIFSNDTTFTLPNLGSWGTTTSTRTEKAQRCHHHIVLTQLVGAR
jgi:hypothetical protein